jgi:putative transposase
VLTDDGFQVWCLQKKIPAQTKAYIERIRSSQPVRKVCSRASNVSGRYPSAKMGRTIQFESRHVELWRIYQMVRDDDVLEYYDQPIRIQLQYRDPVGKQIVTTTRTTCTYLGIIKVTRLQFHEAGTTCVECPTCGARRTLKSP